MLTAAALAVPGSTLADSPQANGAIHGGHATSISQYPWMVSLQSDGSHFCGGSLIAARWVLTAAHCVVDESASTMEIMSGSSTLSGARARNIFRVRRIIVHPRYNAANNANDIALVELRRSAGARIRPLGPGGNFLTTAGDRGRSLGWGPTGNDNPDELSNRLEVVTLPIYGAGRCADLPPTYNNRIMICAGNGTFGTCKGDSGGPLIVRAGRHWVLAGLTSYGEVSSESPCDVQPGAYTRVSAYRGFVGRYTGTGIFAG